MALYKLNTQNNLTNGHNFPKIHYIQKGKTDLKDWLMEGTKQISCPLTTCVGYNNTTLQMHDKGKIGSLQYPIMIKTLIKTILTKVKRNVS